jgi:hypothetical protein
MLLHFLQRTVELSCKSCILLISILSMLLASVLAAIVAAEPMPPNVEQVTTLQGLVQSLGIWLYQLAATSSIPVRGFALIYAFVQMLAVWVYQPQLLRWVSEYVSDSRTDDSLKAYWVLLCKLPMLFAASCVHAVSLCFYSIPWLATFVVHPAEAYCGLKKGGHADPICSSWQDFRQENPACPRACCTTPLGCVTIGT